MSRKNCYYDVVGDPGKIYTQHFVSDGYTQDWLHFHSRYELTFVASGKTELNDNGVRYRTDEPHIRLHKPFAFHTANAESGTTYECFVFYFTEASLSRFGQAVDLVELYSENMRVLPLEGDRLECAKSLASLLLLDISDEMLALALKGLLTLVMEGGIIALRPGSGDLGYIKDVLACVSSEFSEKLTAAGLAKRFFVSEQKLSADFKAAMNETLHHYIVSARVSNAAMMIAKGSSPVSAALECGFIDETHFSKTFKDRMGMTPTKFSKTFGKSLEYPEDFDPKNTVISSDPPPDFYNNRVNPIGETV